VRLERHTPAFGLRRTSTPATDVEHHRRRREGHESQVRPARGQQEPAEHRAETIEHLRSRTVSHQFLLAQRKDRPTESLPQHLAVIDAISRREADDAARAMRSHLNDVARAIREIGN
jgi:hypothetical protein